MSEVKSSVLIYYGKEDNKVVGDPIATEQKTTLRV